MGFNSAFKGLKLLKKIRERAFKQFKWPLPQCVKDVPLLFTTKCCSFNYEVSIH